MTTTDPTRMSRSELLNATVLAARDERRATGELLALLAEVDARRLYLGEGCSSLFAYCTQVLRLSEHAAYHRIEAARAVRQYPVILERVTNSDLTLTAVALLRPYLTPENHEALLASARHKSKREVEYQIACLAPKVAAKALLRCLPDRQAPASEIPNRDDALAPPDALIPADGCGGVVAEPAADTGLALPRYPAQLAMPAVAAPLRPTVAPLASDRYLLRLTLSADAHSKLRRAQDLLRHVIPDGDPGAIFDRALTLLLERLEKAKTAQTARPRRTSDRVEPSGGGRYIPAPVKRAVWARDAGRCAFVGVTGRCTETGCLEYHHVIPFARGGQASVSNIALRCRAHNGFESELVFGRWSGSAGTRTRSGPS